MYILEKNRASYRLFWLIIFCSFDRIYFFYIIWTWKQEVFMKYLKYITWEHCVFERVDVRFNKIWAWVQFVFWKIDVFDTTWVWERLVFRNKSEKKAFYWLFWTYSVVLTYFTFFDHNGHNNGGGGGFTWKKNTKMKWEHCVFDRMDVCLTKCGY